MTSSYGVCFRVAKGNIAIPVNDSELASEKEKASH